MIRRKFILAPFAFVLGHVVARKEAHARDTRFFRIGTGGMGGTYYPIGELIASAISDTPELVSTGSNSGVDGLIAVAQSANGSVANVLAIADGALESGFAQSDIVSAAYRGVGDFKNRGPIRSLRVIANLYRETIHLVARRGSGIETTADLLGRHVSLDEPGSGTLVEARLILDAFGLSERKILPQYVKPSLAASRMRDGRLDAFFIVAGYPMSAVEALLADDQAYLVPIDGPQAEALTKKAGFLSRDRIPAGVYSGTGEIRTLSVGAQWVVSSELDDDLIYAITSELWRDRTGQLLKSGHAQGSRILLKSALSGVDVPLHPGAARYYREQGMID
jgi:TRAP transporter TAXI family solute receptor